MKTLLLSLLAVASLTACATNRLTDSDRLSLYQAHAGEPVKQIRYYSAMGWDRIDDEHVVLNMRPTENWLVKISGPCLDWGSASPTLRLKTSGNVITPKFDSIITDGSPISCRIEKIRPVDVKAIRAAQNAVAAQSPAGT